MSTVRQSASALEQLDLWVEGISTHCPAPSGIKGYQCCPDFSCCGGDLAPEVTRKAFAKAYRADDEDTYMTLLGGFLMAMLGERGQGQQGVHRRPATGEGNGVMDIRAAMLLVCLLSGCAMTIEHSDEPIDLTGYTIRWHYFDTQAEATEFCNNHPQMSFWGQLLGARHQLRL